MIDRAVVAEGWFAEEISVPTGYPGARHALKVRAPRNCTRLAN